MGWVSPSPRLARHVTQPPAALALRPALLPTVGHGKLLLEAATVKPLPLRPARARTPVLAGLPRPNLQDPRWQRARAWAKRILLASVALFACLSLWYFFSRPPPVEIAYSSFLTLVTKKRSAITNVRLGTSTYSFLVNRGIETNVYEFSK